MFVNLSNHNSKKWSEEQLEAAREYGDIVDIQFPNIDPYMSNEEISALAKDYSDQIKALEPDCVMCQGEQCFAYEVTNNLKEEGIKVVAACSERKTVERQLEDGRTEKTAVFGFTQFREIGKSVEKTQELERENENFIKLEETKNFTRENAENQKELEKTYEQKLQEESEKLRELEEDKEQYYSRER